MPLPRHQQLRRKASLALRSGDPDAALSIYRELEALEPGDPTWPSRAAEVLQGMGRSDEALACLQRALELQVNQGEVLSAIATCKQILEIEPDHPATLDCLHLLYTETGAVDSGRPTRRAAPPAATAAMPAHAAAPLEELQLTEVIPDARAVALGDTAAGCVTEIPLEDSDPGYDTLRELDVDLMDEVQASLPADDDGYEERTDGADSDPIDPAVARRDLLDTPLFGSLDADTLRALLPLVRIVHLDEGETLFRQGDAADCLYVVAEGAVVPIAEGTQRKRMAVLEKGAFFGEAGLVTNQPRNATIEALVETRLIALDREVMWSLIRGRPELSKVVLRFLRQRLIDRQISTHPFFAAFSRADRPSVARQFRFLEVKDAVPVLEQGVRGEGLFVLLAGTMDVVDDEQGKLLGSLRPGDVFGGRSVACDEPSRASVVADGKCWVLVLGRAKLRRVLEANPKLERQLSGLADGGDLGPFGL